MIIFENRIKNKTFLQREYFFLQTDASLRPFLKNLCKVKTRDYKHNTRDVRLCSDTRAMLSSSKTCSASHGHLQPYTSARDAPSKPTIPQSNPQHIQPNKNTQTTHVNFCMDLLLLDDIVPMQSSFSIFAVRCTPCKITSIHSYDAAKRNGTPTCMMTNVSKRRCCVWWYGF